MTAYCVLENYNLKYRNISTNLLMTGIYTNIYEFNNTVQINDDVQCIMYMYRLEHVRFGFLPHSCRH